MKWKYVLFILCLSLLYACSQKTRKLLHGGKVNNSDFRQEIPFDYSYGVPIIEVEIENQTYRFLFDTGAPTVLDVSVAKKLKYNSIVKQRVFDSQGNKEKEKFIQIPNIKIGEVHFTDIGAVISDIQKTFEISCLKIDGIIGANLMGKAYWKLDFQDQMITVSSQEFFVPESAFTLNFKPQKNQLTPKVEVKIDGKKIKNVSVDTGSNGAFDFEEKDYPEILNKTQDIQLYGSASAGVYGRGKNEVQVWSNINKLTFGDLSFKNQIISFQKNTARTIGNEFLDNYIVYFDWKTNKIHLAVKSRYDYDSVTSFGFFTKIEDDKLKVAAVIQNSMAEEFGIEPEMQIISINGKSFENLEGKECFYAFNSPFPNSHQIQVCFLINNKKRSFTFYKQKFL
ncbi:retropepsin-like aspartic protease [Aureivirga sp. CE67]|uniref:retropepsin-like aspartic protease n=1 Tax=Aureivirga sp. CE67 TaxID=1788983 RepID=UPI0018CA317F|nr:aspartyl protease family protein [Aureivirga sp. CE67]